jgi:FkbM family methyltransferase
MTNQCDNHTNNDHHHHHRFSSSSKNQSMWKIVLFACGLNMLIAFRYHYNTVQLLDDDSMQQGLAGSHSSKFSSKSSFVWDTIPVHKRGRGVVFCAYSFDTQKSLPKFLNEAIQSAKTLKQNNPTIPIAIITNAVDDNDASGGLNSVFDHVIHVKDSYLFRSESTRADGVYRQWFTRIVYLAHSPYQTTWFLDSHAQVLTTRLEQAFSNFERSDIDIATSSSQPNGFYCHNFAILFRWNHRVRNLFIDWILRQLERGISTDDQGPLCQAMGCAGGAYGLKYGYITPPWALAWLSLRNGDNNEQWKHRTTRVLRGKPQICHSADVCQVASALSSSQKMRYPPRVLYMDASKGVNSSRVFYSQTEIESSRVLPYSYTWENWNPPEEDVVVMPTKIRCPSPPNAPLSKVKNAIQATFSKKTTKQVIGQNTNEQKPSPKVTNDIQACNQTLVTRPVADDYGAWTFCESVVQNPIDGKRPRIISFGIGTNMDWERIMIEQYNAIVYAHDPTPKSIQYVREQVQKYPQALGTEQNFVFRDVGLGAKDQDNVTMFLPKNPNFVSARIGENIKEPGSKGSVQIRIVSMPTTLRMHNLTAVDIVKWDVEGIEFDILQSLFGGNNIVGIPTRLLLLEWHGRFHANDPKKQQTATDQLAAAGFVKLHTSKNQEEEVFFNTRFAVPS